jgi:NAD(P)-dependent dehydrogenase (short-subunit alcohol dehydrogenase family)
VGNEFADQVVIVTGASRGIGKAAAIAFAQKGAKVIINYLGQDAKAKDTLNQIEAMGGKGWLFRVDLSQLDPVEKMINQIEQEIGPIHVLVNNAAAFNREPFLDISIEELDRVWNTNVRGMFYLSQLAARPMAARQKGSIVHVSSIGARLAVMNRSVYCASKGAMESLTRCMALDLAPYHIRVNAISPGVIRTDGLLDGMSDPSLATALEAYIPGGRLGEPEEVASVIVFLASEEARYINGAIIPVDGSLGAREAGFPYKSQ